MAAVPQLVQLAGPLLAIAVYLAYRRVFADMPLHMDTGFYVPNRAVRERRLAPFGGWNTYFSGGSRALPQLVHTALYLRWGAQGYARAFRVLYGLLGGFAAWVVAGAAETRFGVDARPLALGLGLALGAEAHYGVYFESAEWFELPLHAAVVAGLLDGSATGLVGAAALLWFDVAAIKLSAAAPALLVSLAVVVTRPSLTAPVLGVAALAIAGLATWQHFGGVDRRRLLGYLRAHERHVCRDYGRGLLLVVKAGFLARLVLRNPAIPLAAIAGALHLSPARLVGDDLVLSAYAFGVVAGYFGQGQRVWYYAVPFFPLATVLATGGVLALGGGHAATLGAAVVAASVGVNLVRHRGADGAARAAQVFSVYDRPRHAAGSTMAAGNAAVARFCAAIRDRVAGHDMVVLGRYNQASVLCDAARDTPLVSLCALAEGVAGPPARWPGPPVHEPPPRFVLDTDQAWSRYRSLFEATASYRLLEQQEALVLYERMPS